MNSEAIFLRRTKAHRDLIRMKSDRIINASPLNEEDKKELEKRAYRHDLSKYSPEEKEGFILITDLNRRKEEIKTFGRPVIKKAIEHHFRCNRHHPEYYNDLKDMQTIDMAEMVADLAAMSAENNNDLKLWIDNITLVKYKWTKEQTHVIKSFALVF